MLWPKNNSYKEFDNEKENSTARKSPPPPPHNFSNGPSLRRLNYMFIWQISCILLGLKCRYDLMRNDRDVMIYWLFAMLILASLHDGQKWVVFLPHGSLETHRRSWNIPNETKLGRNIVKESPHVLMVVLYFWLTAWRHKWRWNMALKFGINYLT